MSNASSNDSKPANKLFEGLYGPFSAIGITILSYIMAGFLVTAGILTYISVTHADRDKFLDSLSGSTIAQTVFTVVTYGIMLGVVFWFMRAAGVSRATIGFGRKPKLSDVGSAVMYAVAYFVTLLATIAIVKAAIPAIDTDQRQQLGFDTGTTDYGQLVLVFFSLVIVAPLVEEIIVRGFLYSGLRKKLGVIVATLLASLLFAIPHLQLGQGAVPLYTAAIDTFLLSLFLITLRIKTGSLWAGILVHMLKNSIAFIALFILKA